MKSELHYDVVKDFQPVIRMAEAPNARTRQQLFGIMVLCGAACYATGFRTFFLALLVAAPQNFLALLQAAPQQMLGVLAAREHQLGEGGGK